MILVLIASVFLPTGLAIAFFWLHRKWRDRQGRTLPIAGRRIAGAGEQLRKRIEDHTDRMHMGLTILFFVGPYFVAAWALKRIDWSKAAIETGDLAFAVSFVAIAAWAVRTIIRHGNLRRRGLAGLQAEMYTAQELNRLVGDSCVVFHDVPGDGFNLDHVVIGPGAVYVVETKSVRKPRNSGKDDHYKVHQDGDALRFPDFTSYSPTSQARSYAQWLARYLRDATQKSIPVLGTVALPGWYITGQITNDLNAVRAFTPAGRGAKFMVEDRGRPLDQATIGLVTQALLLRYPIAE